MSLIAAIRSSIEGMLQQQVADSQLQGSADCLVAALADRCGGLLKQDAAQAVVCTGRRSVAF